MSGTIDPTDWRTWRREGAYIIAPDEAPMDQRLAATWALTCEEYGIGPDNPAPMRKGVFRKGLLRDQ